jgi:DNA-binding beta-propeller fold protein YncE
MPLRKSATFSPRPLIALVLAASCACRPDACAQVIGVAADDTNNAAVVFDAETAQILAMIPLSGSGLGDCVISVTHQLAFVSDFSGRISVIDLAATPPRLAEGVSRITISNAGQDMAITPDGRFLIVAGGGNPAPLCVINIEERRQVSTFSTGGDNNSVAVAEDGSVLASSRNSGRIRRLTINDAGVLTNTGDFLAFSQPNNVVPAPGGMFGVGVGRAGGRFGSFAIAGMSSIDVRAESEIGLCGTFSPDGARFYARFTSPGMIEVYDFDPVLGRLSPTPVFAFSVPDAPAQFGVDQIAMHPDGLALYVCAPGGVRMHHPETGALLGTISHVGLGALTGIALADLTPEPANLPPSISMLEPILLRSCNHQLEDLGPRAMAEDPDGDAVTLSFAMLSNEAEVDNGDGSGRHAPDFKDEMSEGGRGFLVRAERMGSGDGRFYLLVVTADDGRGGVTRDAGIAAIVPHDNSRRSLQRVMAAAEAALADLRDALANDGPIPGALHEVGVSDDRGPKQ